MTSIDNTKEVFEKFIIIAVIFLIIGLGFIFAYNLMGASDKEIFDDNNKFIDPTIENPNQESNYNNIYTFKKKVDDITISVLKLVGKTKAFVFLSFIILILAILIFKNRRSIMDSLKSFF